MGDDSSGVSAGGSLTFTATVAGPGAALTPTGSIAWTLTGPNSPSCSSSTLSISGTATCTVSGVVVGTYGATASYSGDSYYTGSSGSDTTATVGPAALTITASSGSFTYGGTPPSISPSYAGFVNGDSPSALSTLPSCSTPAVSSSPVSGSPYPSTCSGAVDSNYDISYVNGSVTISAAPLSVTASDGTMTYGGSAPAITAGYTGFVNGDTASSLSTKPKCLTTADSSSSVAGSPYATSCSGAVDSNYNISYAGGFVTVNPAALTVSASNGAMVYGGTPPTITVAGYAGFVNGETRSSLSTKPTCSTSATSSSPVSGSPYPSS